MPPVEGGLVEYRTVRLLEREGLAPSILDFSVENHHCEFRTPGESVVVVEYAALTGGRPHYWFLRLNLSCLQDGQEPPAAIPGGFGNGLRQGRITTLQRDPLFARWFACAYAGVDPD